MCNVAELKGIVLFIKGTCKVELIVAIRRYKVNHSWFGLLLLNLGGDSNLIRKAYRTAILSFKGSVWK